MSVLLFLSALSLDMFYRASVVPLLVVSGSVFGILGAFILSFLILMKLKLVQAIMGIAITSLFLFFMFVNSGVTIKKPLELVANLVILERLTQGEWHKINTRSLDRVEYEPIRDFYYDPEVNELLWGVGDQNVSSGVPHNKLAELGLVSFAIFKLWEFLLLLDLTSKIGFLKKVSAFALWMMLSGYIFALYVPSLFLLLAGLFQGMKSNSANNTNTVNQRFVRDHGQ